MKPAAAWLLNVFRRRAPAVAAAYRQQLDPRGDAARLILADLAVYCRAGQSAFVPGDPHQTSFNAGAQDVFWHIAEVTGLTPHDLPHLIQETQHED